MVDPCFNGFNALCVLRFIVAEGAAVEGFVYHRFKAVPLPSAIQVVYFCRVKRVKLLAAFRGRLDFGNMPESVAGAFRAAYNKNLRALA